MLLFIQFFHQPAGRSKYSQYVSLEACTVTEFNKLLRLTAMLVSSNQLVFQKPTPSLKFWFILTWYWCSPKKTLLHGRIVPNDPPCNCWVCVSVCVCTLYQRWFMKSWIWNLHSQSLWF